LVDFGDLFVPVNIPHMQGKNAVTKGGMLLIFSYPRKYTNCLEHLFRLDLVSILNMQARVGCTKAVLEKQLMYGYGPCN
jgi:hypothetical protein